MSGFSPPLEGSEDSRDTPDTVLSPPAAKNDGKEYTYEINLQTGEIIKQEVENVND